MYSLRGWVKKLVSREPLLTLGKASLEVFCAHLVFVFVGLSLLYGEVPQLHGFHALVLLVLTFVGLMYVASNWVKRKQALKQEARSAAAKQAETATQAPGLPLQATETR